MKSSSRSTSHSHSLSLEEEVAATSNRDHDSHTNGVNEMGNESSRPKHEPPVARSSTSTPSKAVAAPVPVPGAGSTTNTADDVTARDLEPPPAPALEPSGPPREMDHIPPAQILRPPRLPLPIEEEVYTPGSPIISPADITSALNQDPLEAGLPRRTSLLSSTTADDDEVGDELRTYGVEPSTSKKTVPTLVEWRGKGDKVYVTGTFAGWNKKFRLHKKLVYPSLLLHLHF